MIQLDILRGAAVLLVFGHHVVVPPEQAGVFEVLARGLQRFGWTGVDLFFVLSGFLIGGLLFQELRTRSHLDVRRFIIRRGFKLWPSYFLYLAVVFLLLLGEYQGNVAGPVKALLPNLMHLQNYLGTPRGHTWSLAVEEHFYVILPFLLLFLVSRRNAGLAGLRAVPFLALGLVVFCGAARLLANLHGPYQPLMHYNPTHLRMDSLFFGVLLAYLYHFKPDWMERIGGQRRLLLALGIGLISPMMILDVRTSPFVRTLGFTLLYLGYGCVLLAIVHTPIGVGRIGRALNGWLARTIAFIGFYSYTIYLWHMDLARFPLQRLAAAGFLSELGPSLRWLCLMFIYVLAGCAIGALLGRLVDRPALALRDRFFPARADALGPHHLGPSGEVASRPEDTSGTALATAKL